MLETVGTIIITWYLCQAYYYTDRYDKAVKALNLDMQLSLTQRILLGIGWPLVWNKLRQIKK